jgi:hypothetical protein
LKWSVARSMLYLGQMIQPYNTLTLSCQSWIKGTIEQSILIFNQSNQSNI